MHGSLAELHLFLMICTHFTELRLCWTVVFSTSWIIRCEHLNGFSVTDHYVEIYSGVRRMTKACGKRYFDHFCERLRDWGGRCLWHSVSFQRWCGLVIKAVGYAFSWSSKSGTVECIFVPIGPAVQWFNFALKQFREKTYHFLKRKE